MFRPAAKLPIHPRKVRGGLKLRRKDGESSPSWVTERLNRIIERAADGDALREGLEYARAGQVKKLDILDGTVTAAVQGRRPKAYTVGLAVRHFTHDERERVIRAMVDQAVHAAKLLAGEMPPNIEDLFAPLNLKLFPVEPADFTITSTAPEYEAEAAGGRAWSKHAVCVAALLAEHLGDDPFLIFNLRGMASEDLLERLRQRRALSGQGPGPSAVYSPHVSGVSDRESKPLDEVVDEFWDAGPELERVELAVRRPTVNCPLLRRLGPSPFLESRFPMVGLLQTCYEVISERSVQAAGDETSGPGDGSSAAGGAVETDGD